MKSTEINLLPLDMRGALVKERRRRLAWFYGKVVIVLLSLIGAELFALNLASAVERTSLAEGGTWTGQLEEFRTLESRAAEIGRALRTAETFLLRTPPAALVLEEVVAAVPAGITLTRIRFLAREARLEFSGRAATRAALLLLEQNLKENHRVLSVDIPLASFTKARDVDFALTVGLKGEQE